MSDYRCEVCVRRELRDKQKCCFLERKTAQVSTFGKGGEETDHGEISVDQMLGLLEGDDLERELFGSKGHLPIRANGLAICPVGIPTSADVRVIEAEAAVREYGLPCPPTAWAIQAFFPIAYERRRIARGGDDSK